MVQDVSPTSLHHTQVVGRHTSWLSVSNWVIWVARVCLYLLYTLTLKFTECKTLVSLCDIDVALHDCVHVGVSI